MDKGGASAGTENKQFRLRNTVSWLHGIFYCQFGGKTLLQNF